MHQRLFRLFLLAFVFVALTSVSGCVTLRAAQRGILADSMMSFDPQEDPTAVLEGGVYAINNMENSQIYAGGSQGASSGCPSCK